VGRGALKRKTRMARPLIRFAAATLSLVCLLAAGGCSSGGAPITKKDEDLMRRPVGSVPMPPEAAAAMQRANENAARAARQPARR